MELSAGAVYDVEIDYGQGLTVARDSLGACIRESCTVAPVTKSSRDQGTVR
jgi:hypothetical protein